MSFNTVFILVGLATLLILVLIVTLSLRLRKDEIHTMFTMGSSRYKTFEILGLELLILVLLSAVVAAVLYFVTGFFVDDLSMLFLAQIIHAFSFGVFHAVGISLVHDYFTGSHQGRGQALYSSVSFGAGVAVGSLISGMVWDQWGAEILFVFASCCTLLAMAIVWNYWNFWPRVNVALISSVRWQD